MYVYMKNVGTISHVSAILLGNSLSF